MSPCAQEPECPELTVKEVAGRMRVSVETVYRWLEQDALPGAYRLNETGHWRIPEAALDSIRPRTGEHEA